MQFSRGGVVTVEVRYQAFTPTGVPSADSAIEQIIEQAKRTLACDALGVLTRRRAPGGVDVLTSSEPAAAQADELQVRYGEGPGLSTSWVEDVCLSGDTRSDVRWPRWGPRVAELGWLSVLATPLATPQRNLGILTLYSRQPEAFAAAAGAARIFALYAATALASALQTAELEEAVAARHRIGLAQGILMQERGLSSEAAFDLLRRYSQHHNLKLRAVAQHVVDTGQLPSVPTSKVQLTTTQAA